MPYRTLALIALVMLPAFGALAQQYPTRPVRVIMPSAAGGGIDTLARLVSQRLTEKLGQQFIVDARPGATGPGRFPRPRSLVAPKTFGRPLAVGRFGERAAVQPTKREWLGPGRSRRPTVLGASAHARNTAVAGVHIADVVRARIPVVRARHERSGYTGTGGADIVERTGVFVAAGFRVGHAAETRGGLADVVGHARV